MGLFSSLTRAVVRTVSLPLDVVSDTARAVTGRTPDRTAKKASQIVEDLEEAAEDLLDDED